MACDSLMSEGLEIILFLLFGMHLRFGTTIRYVSDWLLSAHGVFGSLSFAKLAEGSKRQCIA